MARRSAAPAWWWTSTESGPDGSGVRPDTPRASRERSGTVGALSRNDESAPEAQKNCHGLSIPKLAPRASRMRSAGTMVTKIPAKTIATSLIG